LDNAAYKYYNDEIAKSFKYGEEVLKALFYSGDYKVIQRELYYPLSSKKLNSLKKIAEV
jgi:hypothetical protein